MPSIRQSPLTIIAKNVAGPGQSNPRLSTSIDAQTAGKVRDLAVKARVSHSAIVEVALRQYFTSGTSDLRGVLERLGIPRHRRQQ
jgi:hypothetical protein